MITHREGLINMMVEFHFPHKLLNVIKLSIMETWVKVGIEIIKQNTNKDRTKERETLYRLYYLILH